MKRYIRSNKYLTEDSDVLFDDSIYIDIDMSFEDVIVESSSGISKFPGVEQFKKDALNILENKYNFEVIEDVYDGVKQKGHTSNKDGSVSIYFDTYFDLSNAQIALDNLGISSISAPESGKVFCFIHIRFSDHVLNDLGDVEHRSFIQKNAEKYVNEKSASVTHVIPEEEFEVTPEELYMYYDEALSALEAQLDTRIVYWIRKANMYRRRS